MTSAAITFFILAIVAVVAGVLQIGSISVDTVEVISLTSLTLGVMFYIISIIPERKNQIHQS